MSFSCGRIELDQKLKELIDLEEYVFKSTEQSLQKAKEIFPKFDKSFLQNLLYHAATLFTIKQIAELFIPLGKPSFPLNFEDPFAQYLYLKNVLTKEDFHLNDDEIVTYPLEDFEEIFKHDSIQKYIKDDEVNPFVKYVTLNNIDIIKDKVNILNQKLHIVDIACFCGSINILKYLYINNVPIKTTTIQRAVHGGSEKIIDFLEMKGFVFDETLSYAVWRHNNVLAKWIYENYQNNTFYISECSFSFNTEMLIYFLEQGKFDVNQIDDFGYNLLSFSILNNDLILTEFLFLVGAKFTIEIPTSTPKIKSNEMKELIEKYKC